MVHRVWIIVTSALACLCFASGSLAQTAGTWQPPSGARQLPLWPDGVPDMADVSQPAESLRNDAKPIGGRSIQQIASVSVPTLTVFKPKGRNSGAAIVVFPGGGFQLLSIDLEGTEICDWVTAQGMTCLIVKYRIPNTNVHRDADCKCMVMPKIIRSLQDAQRAIRLTRSRAQELGVDPNKIGVLGFSAGGFLVAQTSNIFEPAYKPVDAIDQISSRPDFAVAAYPGAVCRDQKLDPSIRVTKQTPPTFIVQAWDDRSAPICNATLYARELDAAGVPAEVHLFARGGHAFAMRQIGHPVETWPALLKRWLQEMSIL